MHFVFGETIMSFWVRNKVSCDLACQQQFVMFGKKHFDGKIQQNIIVKSPKYHRNRYVNIFLCYII